MKLILPNQKYLQDFVKAGQEYKNSNVFYYKGFYDDADTFLKKCELYRLGKNLKENRVPQTTYWLIDNDEMIGQINIRHFLNEQLEKHGGHIGYGIRIPFQKQGYGTKILSLGLEKAKKMGIKKVLITCNENNIASSRVIEKNGGVLENKIKLEDNVTYKRYWISL